MSYFSQPILFEVPPSVSNIPLPDDDVEELCTNECHTENCSCKNNKSFYSGNQYYNQYDNQYDNQYNTKYNTQDDDNDNNDDDNNNDDDDDDDDDDDENDDDDDDDDDENDDIVVASLSG